MSESPKESQEQIEGEATPEASVPAASSTDQVENETTLVVNEEAGLVKLPILTT